MNVLSIVARSFSSHVLNVEKEIAFKVKTSINCHICYCYFLKHACKCLQIQVEISFVCRRLTVHKGWWNHSLCLKSDNL